MIRYEDIIEKLVEHHPDADIKAVQRAYVFSAQHHKDQIRLSGEPYLVHPVEVAYILVNIGLDATAAIVGLLHDVLEDTLVSYEELEGSFGPEVAKIVEGVTKISKIPFTSLEQKQAENFRKMLVAMTDDLRVILVKLADRLHNMRTLQHQSEEKQKIIATETEEIYVPIAHRLGIGRIKQELEDLCFLYLDPEKYISIKKFVDQNLPVNMEYIRTAKERMDDAMRQNEIPCTIEHRIKGIKSIYRKRMRLERQLNAPYDFHDYIAFRIITNEIKYCYAALGILHSIWTPVPGQFDDYIANPKPNDYQSLHTVLVDRQLRFEVQIRTWEMHRISEMGIAAHYRYKEGRAEGHESWVDRYYDWLRGVLENQQEVDDPHEFLRSFKVDLQPDEVYTFTPKGKLLALPAGSTPLDFAYAIHTDIGHTCVGAKVNAVMVPLDTKLRSGDTVLIITSKDHHPNRDWLNIVVTSRARNKIRQFLNRQEKEKSVEVGKRLLEKEARRHGLSIARLKAQEGFERAIRSFGVDSVDDLFSAVGFGRVAAKSLIVKVLPDVESERPAVDARLAKPARSEVAEPEIGEGMIEVRGVEDVLTYIAPCCQPVFGEPIIGYVTRGKGIAVHRIDCQNITDLHPERRIEVSWAAAHEGVMPAGIVLTTEDKQGILAGIMNRIDKAKINIRGLNAKAFEDSTAEISMTLEVRDIQHLNAALQAIREVPGVIAIRRL